MTDEIKIREQLAKEIIDSILDKAEEINFAWHYGEESLLVADVVNIVNNVAKTDYKRYGNGFLKEKWNPHCRDPKCDRCTNFFSRFDKHEHREHCAGKENATNCSDYEDSWT